MIRRESLPPRKGRWRLQLLLGRRKKQRRREKQVWKWLKKKRRFVQETLFEDLIEDYSLMTRLKLLIQGDGDEEQRPSAGSILL